MEEISQLEVINFANITDEKFTGIYGGKYYTFEPHSVTPLSKLLAEHFANQLAVKILMANGKDWGNDSPLKMEKVGEILGKVKVEEEVKTSEVKPNLEVPMVVAKEVPEKEFEGLDEGEKVEGSGVECSTCHKFFKTEAAMKAHDTRMHKI